MTAPLSRSARWAVLACALAGLVFDGIELGLMPIASLSVSRSLLGEAFTQALGGVWFARFTAALMLGAACGGIVLGNLGDRIGRTRAMGVSILFYSLFAVAGGWVRSQEEMLVLRFLVGLGVGGMWPNAMALVAECWPEGSRAVVSGVMSAGLNFGILILSQLARAVEITPDSWRWLFLLGGIPALLGIAVLLWLPESPSWVASRRGRRQPPPTIRELFSPLHLPTTLVAMVVATIPLVGAWSAGKWMIPWADAVSTQVDPGYKAATQGWWAVGAALGSFFGAQLVRMLGRRRSYLVVSLGSLASTVAMFQLSAPLRPGFHALVFIQGFVATLFFGWLAVFLPAFFPERIRASGCGLAYNVGRFATAAGVAGAGILFTAFGGDYARVGAACAIVYAFGVAATWLLPKAAAASEAETPT